MIICIVQAMARSTKTRCKDETSEAAAAVRRNMRMTAYKQRHGRKKKNDHNITMPKIRDWKNTDKQMNELESENSNIINKTEIATAKSNRNVKGKNKHTKICHHDSSLAPSNPDTRRRANICDSSA